MLNRREFQTRLAAAGIGGLSLWLPGCEQRKPIPTTGASGAPLAAKPVVIGMIAKSQSNPVFLAARKGAEDRAKTIGEELNTSVRIDWRTPDDEDAQQQAEFIEQLVAAGADAITIACSDAAKVTRAIDDAIERGVSVMCFDSDAPESNRLCYVGTDDEDAGRQVMRETIALLGDREGTIAILAGNQTATNLQRRVRGAREELEGQAGKLTLKDVYYHKETPQDSYAQVESVQKANPDIVGWAMIGGWPLMTERALPWTAGDVVCVSMDTLPAQLEHLRMGDVQVLLGQQYYYFGQQCVDILAQKSINDAAPAQEVDFAALDRVTGENVEEYAKNWEKWS